MDLFFFKKWRIASPPRRRVRPCLRHGFIFLFGTQAKVSDDARGQPVEALCPACHHRASMLPKRQRLWLSLFLVPAIPLTRATPIAQCENCGTKFGMSPDDLKNQLDRAQVKAEGQTMQAAIRLYNELRDHPTDSVLLDRVMRAYAAAGEFGEAISAARHFPQALAASVSCQQTLAQIEQAAKAAAEQQKVPNPAT
jgi:zinc ribbon protein